jgi:hypothetical protein
MQKVQNSASRPIREENHHHTNESHPAKEMLCLQSCEGHMQLAEITVVLPQSRPRQPLFTVPGAAQVTLARFGEQDSLGELRIEIQGQPGMSVVQGIEKLAVIRSDAALPIT